MNHSFTKPILYCFNVFFILFIMLLISYASANAEVYQWTDQNGIIRYSDTPPDQADEITDFITMPSPAIETESIPRMAPLPVVVIGKTRSQHIKVPPSDAEIEKDRAADQR